MEGRNHSAEWVLRAASAAIFFGHGAVALGVEERWISFFHVVGLSTQDARVWMPWIGALDIALAVLVLVRPVRVALLWMTAWGMWTALLRPLAGESILEFIERGGNWGAPLALLCLLGWPKTRRAWFSGNRVAN